MISSLSSCNMYKKILFFHLGFMSMQVDIQNIAHGVRHSLSSIGFQRIDLETRILMNQDSGF